MGDHHLELQVAWQRHVAAPLDRFERLLGRHREKHRRYHGVDHVAWVVRHVEELVRECEHVTESGRLGASAIDVDAAIAAAFYHDAVYEPRSPALANERASARLARKDLVLLGWDPERADRVGSMIEATATHLEPVDLTSAVLFDADLGVLAADPSGYGDYVRNVRAEYAHVDDADWRAGRADVLRSFLERPAIYATEPGRRWWEQRARANITTELSSIADR
ncbi:MAG: hypothetical protein AAFP84_15265 [Actinomycetota bacterium]